jgi:hypothetical protein
MVSRMGTTNQGHYAIRTQLGKVIRADYYDPMRSDADGVEHCYWIIWISANRSFTAGTYYRLYADGRFEHWHLYEDGTEERLDAQVS